jgi:hypothetical protein
MKTLRAIHHFYVNLLTIYKNKTFGIVEIIDLRGGIQKQRSLFVFINQKYLFCVLSLLVSGQVMCMKKITGRVGQRVSQASFGAGATSMARRGFSTTTTNLMRATQPLYMTMNQARQILNVSAQATKEDIKQGFRDQALKVHPDQGGSKEQMQQLNEAYDLLKGKNTQLSIDELDSDDESDSDLEWKMPYHKDYDCDDQGCDRNYQDHDRSWGAEVRAGFKERYPGEARDMSARRLFGQKGIYNPEAIKLVIANSGHPSHIVRDILNAQPDLRLSFHEWKIVAQQASHTDIFSDLLEAGHQVVPNISDPENYKELTTPKTFASRYVNIKNIPIAVRYDMPFQDIPNHLSRLEELREQIKGGAKFFEINELDVDKAIKALLWQHAENEASLKKQLEKSQHAESEARLKKQWKESSYADKAKIMVDRTSSWFVKK